MRRDMDKVREILVMISEHGDEMENSFPGKGLAYYLPILVEAELLTVEIEKQKHTYDSGETLRIRSAVRLTWKGNDLLDKIEDEVKWEQIKEVCKKANVTVSLNAIFTIAELLEGNMLNSWINEEEQGCLKE